MDVEEHLAEGKTNQRLNREHVQLRIALITIMVAFALILGRVAYLQVGRGDEYRSQAERNRIQLEIVRAPRGVILDRNREPLLMNVADFTLYAVPADLPSSKDNRQTIAQTLADILPSLDRERIITLLASSIPGSLQPIIIAEHVPYTDAIRLSTAIARLPGISLETLSTRSYVDGTASAHLIGYLGKPTAEELDRNPSLSPLASIGRMGVELQYDELLRGRDGVREVERDHLNKELSIIASQAPTPGNNLVLSIDKGLQDELYAALTETVQRLRVPGGAAVALDPRNGEVLALVSVPSFNPNLFSQGGSEQDFNQIFQDERHPLFFRPISGTYPSGSTIKMIIAAAGLAEKVINERTTVVSTGGLRVGPNFFPDWKSGGHGVTDVRKALADSVNTFFYMVGGGFEDFSGLGIDRIVDYLKRFGLGNKLGIDLPNEAAGFVPDRDWRNRPDAPKWYLGDTYNLSIGQGYISVTPLQIAAVTASVANGGTMYAPHVVREVLRPDGTSAFSITSQVSGMPVNEQAVAIVRSGMRQAVTSGSARRLNDLPTSVAAKTGTAQFGNSDRTHAWITTFAPYERPEIVVSVLVEDGGEGSTNALPVARRALAWYFQDRGKTP